MVQSIVDLLPGVATTLTLWVWSLVLGLPAGLLFGFVLAYAQNAVRWPMILVVNVARGLPALVTLYVFYSGLPALGLLLSNFTSVVGAFAFTTAGYTADIFKSAILTVPKAQREAASALGISFWKTQRLVILPQALRSVLPAVIAFSVIVLQGTSLAYSVGLRETTGLAYNLGSIGFSALRYMLAAGVIYLVLCVAGSQLVALLKRRTTGHRTYSGSKSTMTKEYTPT